MKIMICTTPIGPPGSDYPPFGSLAVIQSLRMAGHDPVLFDIDGLRPSFEDVLARFRAEAPDIIGISAVVSTAYGYVKRLSLGLREVLPNARLVLGGNLAASAEILHRQCGIDVCVIGEGETPMVNLVDYYQHHGDEDDFANLERIKGLTYLAPAGHMVFTGYGATIAADDLLDPDFSILERYSDIEHFITDPFTRPDFSADPRTHERHRVGKKMSTVLSSKGCVARCTFCHRWDRGFRQLSPAKVVSRIRYLIERYNVGFVQFGDENFGSDRKASDELIELMAPLDVLWKVAGMRARGIDPARLGRMREAGCVAVYYGFETGSPELLKVMEKNLELEHNFSAARATHDAGLFTVYQVVLGMPGETPTTIRDTLDMVKRVTAFLPDPPHGRLSINYAQALPGTPLYEYARLRGLIGPTPEDEEAYLLSVSDVPAGSDTTFLNFTAYPYLTVQSWRPRFLYEATVNWIRHSWQFPPAPKATATPSTGRWGNYFNLLDVRYDHRLLVALYPFRWAMIWGWTLVRTWQRSPRKVYFQRLWELMTWPLLRSAGLRDYRSLRQIMREGAPTPLTESDRSMLPLRLGR